MYIKDWVLVMASPESPFKCHVLWVQAVMQCPFPFLLKASLFPPSSLLNRAYNKPLLPCDSNLFSGNAYWETVWECTNSSVVASVLLPHRFGLPRVDQVHFQRKYFRAPAGPTESSPAGLRWNRQAPLLPSWSTLALSSNCTLNLVMSCQVHYYHLCVNYQYISCSWLK